MDFKKLHADYYTEIYQFVFQLSLSVSESQDITQDAFLRLFQEFRKEKRIENPKAWLYKVSLNLWRNRYNKINNKNINKYQERVNTDVYESPENKFISSERREIVFNTINRLPENNRNILLLYHDGLSYGEISEVLDIKITSVGKSVSRSIEKLKKLIKTNHNELFEK